ncbi:glycoside hydrolase family 75 protein [Calothrix sp. NIES-2098]|uniref:glycoside hydrolase family 75 protein n=1 Tax=Calothrix sp. NIES-2098 TaxID=1954171 RepID=UPI000B614B8A|nr:hypothetical protein NIES2098_25000 [Calothrix sp. NIES-2098]
MRSFWSNLVEDYIQSGETLTQQYEPRESVIKLLGNGAIYIKSDMDADADGSPRARIIDPKYGQLATSLIKPKWLGESNYVNAETIPYFVLPANFNSVCGLPYELRELLGDLALIRWQNREIFAIFADVGSRKRIGEGSIKTIEALGGNPWNSDKSRIIKGLPFGVEYLVFPKSTANIPLPATFDSIQQIGAEVFQKIFSSLTVYSMTTEEMKQQSGVNNIEVREILNTPEFKTVTELNCRSGVGTEYSILTVIPANTVVKNKVAYTPGNSLVFNVGAKNNGLWFMVEYQNYRGFVRASSTYIIPWRQDSSLLGSPAENILSI